MSTSQATKAAPTSPSPCTSSSTPAGRSPSNRAATSAPTSGTCSLGLKTTVLPVASAGTRISMGMPRGKFQGVMAATTPCGSRTTTVSCFSSDKMRGSSARATSSKTRGIRLAHSEISSRADGSVLPISRVMSCASSSARASMRPGSSRRWARRSCAGKAAQAGAAARARATAADSSWESVVGTSAMHSPVAGSRSWKVDIRPV